MEQQYLLNAIDAALSAGTEIMAVYNGSASGLQVEMKADHSPLTIADKRAHAAIAKALGGTPYPVLSEEGKQLPYEERRNWKALWVVDPLDGTKEFIKRNGEFTVNIAWVSGSVPMAGVIYVPVRQELYWGETPGGAYKLPGIVSRDGKSLDELRGMAIRLPDAQARHEDYVVVASRSHLTPETEACIAGIRRHHPDMRLVSGGSSIKICLVAEGKADAYPRFAPTMEWDTAAGHAIARAAGMEIYRAGTGQPLTYNKEDLHNPWFVAEKKH